MPKGGTLLTFLVLVFVPSFHAQVYVNLEDISSPDFDVSAFARRVSSEGTIVGRRFENTSCPGVKNKIEEFEYFVIEDELEGDEGERNIFELVTLMDIVLDTDKVINKLEPWISAEVLIRPYLNCFEQGEEFLINALANDHLRPPSVLPYNFSVPVEEVNTWGQYGQPAYIDEVFFKGQVKDGFFIEAGADDFETDSNTLLFELQHNWTGILVEPNPTIFPKGFSKQRKVWGSSTCLAIQPRPHVSPFSQKVTMGGMAGLVSEADEQSYDMQCFPLYSLILATGNRTVNYLSLDIEGAEFLVLQTIPWDKVDIEVISLETNHVGEVFPGSQREVREYLEERGYVMAATVEIDDIFVRRDLYEGKYSPDPEGETRYLSAGGSCVLSSSWKIEELQYVIQYYTQDRLFRIEL